MEKANLLLIIFYFIILCIKGSASEDNLIRPELLERYFTEWSDWSLPSATCGEVTKYRTRSCIKIPWITCKGARKDTKRLFTHCPIDGGWTEWTEWEIGNANQQRSRQCSNPSPQYNGQLCSGDAKEVKYFGHWSLWSAWISFDNVHQDCNQMVSWHRTRTCIKTSDLQICRGEKNQTESKINICHPINGNWGEWTPWRVMSGRHSGPQFRTRQCDNPKPRHDGVVCNGARYQHRQSPNVIVHKKRKLATMNNTRKTIYTDQVLRQLRGISQLECFMKCQHVSGCTDIAYSTERNLCYIVKTAKSHYPEWYNRHRKKLSTSHVVYERV